MVETFITLDDINQLIKHYAFNIQVRLQQFLKWGTSLRQFLQSSSIECQDSSIQIISSLTKKYSLYTTSNKIQLKILKKFCERIRQISQYFIQKCQYSQKVKTNSTSNTSNVNSNKSTLYFLKMLENRIKQKIQFFISKIDNLLKESNEPIGEIYVGEIVEFSINLVKKEAFLKLIRSNVVNCHDKIRQNCFNRKRSLLRSCATSIKVNKYSQNNQNEKPQHNNNQLNKNFNNKCSDLTIRNANQQSKISELKLTENIQTNEQRTNISHIDSQSIQPFRKASYKKRPYSTKNIQSSGINTKTQLINHQTQNLKKSKSKHSFSFQQQYSDFKQTNIKPIKNKKHIYHNISITCKNIDQQEGNNNNWQKIKWNMNTNGKNQPNNDEVFKVRIDKLYVDMCVDRKFVQKLWEKKDYLVKDMMKRNQRIFLNMKKWEKKENQENILVAEEYNQSFEHSSIQRLIGCKNAQSNQKKIKRLDKKVYLSIKQNPNQSLKNYANIKQVLSQVNQYFQKQITKKSLRNVIYQNYCQKRKIIGQQNKEKKVLIRKRKNSVLQDIGDKQNFQYIF